MQRLQGDERPPIAMAIIYDGMGRYEEAADQIVTAYERREILLPFYFGGKFFEKLRDEPRVARILREICITLR